MLAHLTNGYATEQVKDALIATITTLPAHLRRSLTWDEGTEMGSHNRPLPRIHSTPMMVVGARPVSRP
ncbi:MAG: transposase, family [Pseudonocardiales bacterium]|nr:transposase, family [Pseudonocardiales bacterium]